MLRWMLMLALVGAACLSAAGTATGAIGKCESRQAKCAVAAGGQCDHETGHWCYGFYQGRYCGGTSAAFHACMGDRVTGNAGATASAATDKCTSDQARCAKEIGGFCNHRTGGWCVGGVSPRFGRFCGGTMSAFLACLDRVRAARK
jgi:hypothetical protein